eukprot:s308_g31.t1
MGSLQVQLATWVSQILETPTILKEVLAVCQQMAFTGHREMPLQWRVWGACLREGEKEEIAQRCGRNPMLFLQMALNQDREVLTEMTQADTASMGREQTTLHCSQ